MKKQYYIQNRGTCGNSVSWWAINDQGYTLDIRCAKVFDEDDEKLKPENMRKGIDTAWEKSFVDQYVQHHIDIQDLQYRDNNGNGRQYPHPLRQWRPDLCI